MAQWQRDIVWLLALSLVLGVTTAVSLGIEMAAVALLVWFR